MPSQQLPVKTLFSPHGLRDLPGELSCGNRCKSVAKKSPTWDKLGDVWDNIGVILDNIGTIPAQFGHTKTPKISIFILKTNFSIKNKKTASIISQPVHGLNKGRWTKKTPNKPNSKSSQIVVNHFKIKTKDYMKRTAQQKNKPIQTHFFRVIQCIPWPTKKTTETVGIQDNSPHSQDFNENSVDFHNKMPYSCATFLGVPKGDITTRFENSKTIRKAW